MNALLTLYRLPDGGIRFDVAPELSAKLSREVKELLVRASLRVEAELFPEVADEH